MVNMILGIVMVVILVVFLINLFKGSEGDSQKDQAQAQQEQPRREKRSGSLSNDVDRFLEEINRRRQEAADREAAARGAPQRRRRPSSERQPTRQRQETIPTVIPVSRPAQTGTARTSSAPAVALVVAPVTAVGEPLPALPIVPLPGSQRRSASPEIARLMTLLDTPQSLRTAFILKEVLGPPRCRRFLPE